MDINFIFGLTPVDQDGNPVKRTKRDYPYSYDPFVVWDNRQDAKAESAVYSDRLLQWDYDKTRELSKKHFGESGDYYSRRRPESIEAFLCDYFGKKIKLAMIMECCNVSSGYPIWIFYYQSM